MRAQLPFLKTALFALIGVALGACDSNEVSEQTSETTAPKTVAETDIGQTMASTGPIANTAYGQVRGATEDGVLVFKGIPYGAPTGGDNRFLRAKPPATWADVRDTSEYGDQCPQNSGGGGQSAWSSWSREVSQSEDCLVLNIWTHALHDGAKRPVMFWIHGGGFSSFDGSSPAYDGVRLVNRGNVVLVTINHRLNMFGYLHLHDLYKANGGDDKYKESANIGQLDIVDALQWVHDNIANFGGDPNNVMIFGESGGGAKVSTLLAMPAAKGLFQRAAIQSGPSVTRTLPDRATESTRSLLKALNIAENEIDKLQQLSMEELKAGMAAMERGGAGFGPVVNGSSLPRHPFDPDAPTVSADVPLIIGYNKDEGTLTNRQELFSLNWDGLKTELSNMVPGKDIDKIIADLRTSRPNKSASDLYFMISTERGFGDGSHTIAARKAAKGPAPVWLYRLEWETPVQGGKLRTPHSLDIPLIFDTVGLSASIIGEGAGDAQLVSNVMSEFWLSFARDGDPNGPGLPQWPAYNDKDKPTMVFNIESNAVNNPVGDIRAAVVE